MERIRIVIPRDGDPTITVDGVKGTGCKDLTKQLEAALGSTTSDQETPEFYENDLDQGVNQY